MDASESEKLQKRLKGCKAYLRELAFSLYCCVAVAMTVRGWAILMSAVSSLRFDNGYVLDLHAWGNAVAVATFVAGCVIGICFVSTASVWLATRRKLAKVEVALIHAPQPVTVLASAS